MEMDQGKSSDLVMQENSIASLESTTGCGAGTPASMTSLVPSTAAAEEDVVPLSGNPFFSIILTRSHVHKTCYVAIPRGFIAQLPSDDVSVTLYIKGKSWQMQYSGAKSIKRFDAQSWKKFAADNNLKVGDACVFELMDRENLVFKVQILDGTVPPCFTDKSKGYNADAPIEID